ncbi:MAG: hypothetical protein C0524_00620 [Rhodobacter sp.]|nr:hypothetical protein [Rhodobacter sp.]
MPRLAAAIILALSLSPARAELPNLSADASGAPGTATRLVVAQRSYLHALKTGEVLPLLAAIRLARSVTLRPATGWELTTEGTPPEVSPPPGPDPASAVALVIAQNLASEDPDLQDLVYDLDAQLPRGLLETAVAATGALAPGQSDSWRIALFGEVAAELALIGDGKSPLALTLTDDSGSRLCTRPASSNPALCRVTPARNGFFILSITNAGPSAVSYRLIGN